MRKTLQLLLHCLTWAGVTRKALEHPIISKEINKRVITKHWSPVHEDGRQRTHPIQHSVWGSTTSASHRPPGHLMSACLTPPCHHCYSSRPFPPSGYHGERHYGDTAQHHSWQSSLLTGLPVDIRYNSESVQQCVCVCVCVCACACVCCVCVCVCICVDVHIHPIVPFPLQIYSVQGSILTFIGMPIMSVVDRLKWDLTSLMKLACTSPTPTLTVV